mgnify:CR=1 FL=1
MVPEGWDETSVGEALERLSRPVEVESDTKYRQIGIRSHGKGIFDKEAVTGSELGGKRVFWIEPDCFVVNIVFAWEQAVSRTTDADVGKIASHRFPMFRPRAKRCDVRFIEYYFKTPRGKYLLGIASPGGAGRNKTLGQREFERVPLTLPPLREQKKIADILSTWDQAIEKTTALLSNAHTQKRALMQQLLTGRRRFAAFEGQPWKEVRLGDVISISKNRLDPKRDHNARTCIEMEHIEAETGRLIGSTTSDQQASTKAVFGPGDILFGKLRPYLRKFFAPDFDGVCSTEIWVLQPKQGAIVPSFLHGLVQSEGFMEQAEKSAGSKMPRADWKLVSEYRFMLPSVGEQETIANVIAEMGTEIDVLHDNITKLRTEKKALMQQLLTGKRRVVA